MINDSATPATHPQRFAFRPVLARLLVLLGILLLAVEARAQDLASDKAALLALYNATDGDNWSDNTNWLSDEPLSDWYGVTVTNGRVTQLVLRSNQLTGAIPAKLGRLSNLQWLWLYGNQLTGAIPAELGRLSSLQSLYLGGNHLSGSVPRELGDLSNLQGLDLSRNELTDPLPYTLTKLANLANFTFGVNLGLCAPADAAFQAWLRNIPNENTLPGPGVINTTCSATAARNHNVILRVVRVTPDWMSFADIHGWDAAAVHKRSQVLQFYEATIWEEVSAVHFYRFPNNYQSNIPGSAPAEEKIAYREQFLIRKYTDMPEAYTEERSAFLKAAFKDIASHLVRQHPDSDHHLMYSGHGGPGGRLFAALMYPDHANEFLNFWSKSLGRKLGVIDMGGPCTKGSFSDAENFCESTRYYIASDMPNGGYSEDDWSGDKYFETDPETQYHSLFRNGESIEESLRGRIDLRRKKYEYSRNNMITNQVEQANYLYSCAAFREFTPAFKSFLGSAAIEYSIGDDLYKYMIDNGAMSALVEQFNKVIVHRADNRDFFEWSEVRNGMLMPDPARVELGGEGGGTGGSIEGDRDALVALYNATGGSNWANNTNWLSDRPLSEWYGVTTDGYGRVTKLKLGNNQLEGTIPPDLGNLALLEELLLHNNKLTGTLPPSFTNLGALELFSFYGNTDLVVPDDPALRTWLKGITEVQDHDYIPPETASGLFVPVILTASGLNNSFFTSELALTNRGEPDGNPALQL